jgi:predicted RNase H-like HicB family nuclease
MEMIKDAMEGWLAVAREEGVPIPEQSESIEVVASLLSLPRWR